MPTSLGFRDLKVYQLAYQLAMEIFQASKSFPVEEKYSLTDQIRRASRSVAANIAEGYRKKRYPKMFVSKMIDADGLPPASCFLLPAFCFLLPCLLESHVLFRCALLAIFALFS
jgi:hypothetical protein